MSIKVFKELSCDKVSIICGELYQCCEGHMLSVMQAGNFLQAEWDGLR